MACPFFMPIEKLENGTWLHASRLPLGCGWSGHCTAPGHEGEVPSQEELRDFCNLGYAEGCTGCPVSEPGIQCVSVRELGNGWQEWAPGAFGCVTFASAAIVPRKTASWSSMRMEARWANPHPDSRVQRMAECFLASYLEGRKNHGNDAGCRG